MIQTKIVAFLGPFFWYLMHFGNYPVVKRQLSTISCPKILLTWMASVEWGPLAQPWRQEMAPSLEVAAAAALAPVQQKAPP